MAIIAKVAEALHGVFFACAHFAKAESLVIQRKRMFPSRALTPDLLPCFSTPKTLWVWPFQGPKWPNWSVSLAKISSSRRVVICR